MFANPPDDVIRNLLSRRLRIAVVGCSPKPERPSHYVSAQMQAWGYRIVPVHPAIDRLLGESAYGDLSDVPGTIDLVNVFRRAEEVGALVDEAIAIGAPAIWIQLGIVDEAAAQRAVDAGLTTIMNRCIMVERRRLLGGQVLP